MKKLLFFLIPLSLSFASCKKTYVCECEESFTFENQTYSNVETTKSEDKISKREAKDWCSEEEVTENGYTTVCELK